MKHFLDQPEWLKLTTEDRYKLRDKFVIGKTGTTEVINNKLTCDGVTQRDLQALTVAKMIDYLGDELSWYDVNLFDKLFQLTLNKLNNVKPEPSGRILNKSGNYRGSKKETQNVS